MAKRTRPRRPIAALVALNDEHRLIAGLDPLTFRDLVTNPPAGSETMQQIGISKTNLDTVVRGFVNQAFRQPTGKSMLPPGAITPSTTWTQLLGMC